MASYADLTPCDYFGREFAHFLQSVGWLERGIEYPTGPVTGDVYFKLLELRKAPWQPQVAMGTHECTLCQYAGEAHGASNLFIPGDGIIYVCPELITHYMNAHHYAPPAEFCCAVMICPAMRSMDYLKMLLANGGRPMITSTPGDN